MYIDNRPFIPERGSTMPKAQKSDDEVLRCSFCNKHQQQIKKLIAGPTVFICNECVDICIGIIAEDEIARDPTQDKSILIIRLRDMELLKKWGDIQIGDMATAMSALPPDCNLMELLHALNRVLWVSLRRACEGELEEVRRQMTVLSERQQQAKEQRDRLDQDLQSVEQELRTLRKREGEVTGVLSEKKQDDGLISGVARVE